MESRQQFSVVDFDGFLAQRIYAADVETAVERVLDDGIGFADPDYLEGNVFLVHTTTRRVYTVSDMGASLWGDLDELGVEI